MPFQTEEEAIRLANHSTYGLAAGVFTNDHKRANRVAHQINAGTVWINTWYALTGATPFGGYKESGWGRELGQQGYEAFTELKTVISSLG